MCYSAGGGAYGVTFMKLTVPYSGWLPECGLAAVALVLLMR